MCIQNLQQHPPPKKRTKWKGGAPDAPAPDTPRGLETLNKCTIKSDKQLTADILQQNFTLASPFINLSGQHYTSIGVDLINL